MSSRYAQRLELEIIDLKNEIDQYKELLREACEEFTEIKSGAYSSYVGRVAQDFLSKPEIKAIMESE